MAESASAATPPWRLHRLQDSLKLDVDAGGCTIGRAHVVGEPKHVSRSHATFRPAAEGVLDVTFAGQLSFVWSAQRPREWQRLGKRARSYRTVTALRWSRLVSSARQWKTSEAHTFYTA